MRKTCSIALSFILIWAVTFAYSTAYCTAKTADEFLTEAASYYDKGDFDKGVLILEEAARSYPSEPKIQFGLADSYNELGRKRHFSKELALRTIYHIEKFFELQPDPKLKDEVTQFLKKSIAHYDVANKGDNVKMLEYRGDAQDFYLPPDNISFDEKSRYMEKARERLKDYDAARPSPYEMEPSDKSLKEALGILSEDAAKIRSIHYKKYDNKTPKAELLDEVFYKSPDKFKTVQKGQAIIFRGNTMYSIGPASNEAGQAEEIPEGGVQYFDELGKTNFSTLSKQFELNLNKIKRCPNILKTFYGDISSPRLYILTAKTRDDEGSSWPPIDKIEYIIDLDYRLVVAQRAYWKGVLGSGREEELASETVVKRVAGYEDDLYLPSEGTMRGFIEELAGVKEDWSIEVISLNKEIDDSEFDVSRL